ncbi:MAG: hypothetical protein MJZ14_01985 [Paludibacteraceae bacterium]|nr:hypothetical protein [Paludibacteraceae bacterium]
MAKILCPYCFKNFKSTEVMFRCENNSTMIGPEGRPVPICPMVDDKKYSDHWGTSMPMKRYFPGSFSFFERMGWKPLQSQKCSCGVASHKFICPHCHNQLPAEMVEKGSEIISVIGGPASGKSHYIVTLIDQLLKYRNKLGLSVTLQQVGRTEDERTTNMFKKHRKAIFEDKMALNKTQETPHPIPWIVRLESVTTKKAVYLVFYDTAGESFNDAEKVKQEKYFKESKGVIVVFDTLSIPNIKKILESNEIENSDITYDYKETLNTLKVFYQNNSGLKLTERPFAFVFSKFDAVIDNKEDLGCDVTPFVDRNGDFENSKFIKTGKVSMSQIDDCSAMISAYLSDENVWDESALADDIKHIWGDNARYFGVSSLGAMCDVAKQIQVKNGSDQVTPIRVLDPLAWILIKLGGFDIPTDK